MLTKIKKQYLMTALIFHINSLKYLSMAGLNNDVIINKGTILPVNEDETLEFEETQKILSVSESHELDELGCFITIKYVPLNQTDNSNSKLLKVYANDTLFLLFNKIKNNIYSL